MFINESRRVAKVRRGGTGELTRGTDKRGETGEGQVRQVKQVKEQVER